MSAGPQAKDLFDVLSFCRLVNDHGRAYRYQAMRLISICRNFSVVSAQRHLQDAALQRVLRGCDEAITRAIQSRKKITQESEYQFELTIRMLRDYLSEYHPQVSVGHEIDDRMKAAKETDKRKMDSKNLTGKKSLNVVKFRILRSLPDQNPIIVRQALSNSSDLPEILWYFSHLPNESRLVLAQNPHFYADLPTSPTKYVRRFSSQPTEIYHQGMIDVLTNDVRRVFLECHPEPRVFDNVWTINGISFSKTFLESSRAKPSSVEFFQTSPSSGLAWNIQNPNLKWLGI